MLDNSWSMATVFVYFACFSHCFRLSQYSTAANQLPLSHRVKHNNRSQTPLCECVCSPPHSQNVQYWGNSARAAIAPSDWLRPVSKLRRGPMRARRCLCSGSCAAIRPQQQWETRSKDAQNTPKTREPTTTTSTSSLQRCLGPRRGARLGEKLLWGASEAGSIRPSIHPFIQVRAPGDAPSAELGSWMGGWLRSCSAGIRLLVDDNSVSQLGCSYMRSSSPPWASYNSKGRCVCVDEKRTLDHRAATLLSAGLILFSCF